VANFNNTNEMKQQYGTSQNLNSRIRLHQLYSTNPLGWASWVFSHYRLAPNQRILELGCGSATIWPAHAAQLPGGIQLVLSDFSEGMLDTAKVNTSELDGVQYQVIDAQFIPYDDNTFDIVIANHMLYHVPDIDKALAEIKRVLKPSGIFYATTIGNDNLKEMIDLLHDFDARIDLAQDAVTAAFGLESGEAKLSKHFSSVQMNRYEDTLHITEAQPLIDYILSSQGIGNITEIVCGETVLRFEQYIHTLFAARSYIDIVKDAGIFIAANSQND